ncbi:hypothetical protein SAY87_012406 [Trapa incisa]|uniref:RING-type domain-containing protein n=1 Tax=Trapa incisa TaxID=236973 RepID=A0AAN7JIV4_9MYRT|nr:hypothetical protein SAY87_012406 [Trapa incisa]
MGNKLGRRRLLVDEKYTRPQGLYQHKDVDIKKLRKLILESKLAPCYPGDDEYTQDLEECPICFLYYPSLNRSRCCLKGICTECFLQMKVPNSTRPTQCPFCKTSNYAVEYRGVKSKEEKGIEQIEEQRVIEAKIRIRQKELQDEEERMLKRQDLSSSGQCMALGDIECSSAGAPSRSSHAEGEEIVSDASCAPSINSHVPPPRSNRPEEFDLDLEDIMVMEAIWLSIQENGKQRAPCYGSDSAPPEQYVPSEDCYMSPAVAASSASPSGGLACAIAALAERQQMCGESSSSSCIQSTDGNLPSTSLNMLPSCTSYYTSGSPSVDISHADGDWNVEHGAKTAEVGTSYRSSDSMEQDGEITNQPQQGEDVEDDEGFQSLPAPIVPESFEEQMMLAMAVSLAEARAMTNGPGITWH